MRELAPGVYNLIEGDVPVTASVIDDYWLVVGWPTYESVRKARNFFQRDDRPVFSITPGEPKQQPEEVAIRDNMPGVRLKPEEPARLESGTGDHAFAVCAIPYEPEPNAFSNLMVEFPRHRLQEMVPRLVEAILDSADTAFHFEQSALDEGFRALAGRIG
jgi:hypothetical protein